MKRVFTLLCALVLLLTSFSGVFVQAAQADAAVTTPTVEVVAEETLPEAAVTENVAEETLPEATVTESVAEETLPEAAATEAVAQIASDSEEIMGVANMPIQEFGGQGTVSAEVYDAALESSLSESLMN